MILRTVPVGALQTNCYLLACERTRQCLVIDPGDDDERILEAVHKDQLAVQAIVLTHFHFDHLLAGPAVHAATCAPIWIHKDGIEYLAHPPALFQTFSPAGPGDLAADRALRDGDHLLVGDLDVEVLHTPGHSPDSISLHVLAESVLLCGDLVFRDGVGRTDLPGSSHRTMVESIRTKFLTLPDDTKVYPGHGPSTSVGRERQRNPWLQG